MLAELIFQDHVDQKSELFQVQYNLRTSTGLIFFQYKIFSFSQDILRLCRTLIMAICQCCNGERQLSAAAAIGI